MNATALPSILPSSAEPTMTRNTTLLTALALATALGACTSEPPTMEDGTPSADGSVRLTAEQMSAADIEVVEVHLTPLAETLEIPASLMSPDTALAHVGSIVDGRVESVSVITGDEVRVGDELLRIHSHELADAERDVRAARARLAYTTPAVERARELITLGALSREEVQRREAEQEAAEAELERSTERIEHLSPRDGHVVVRAPRAGTVFRVDTNLGDAVLVGTPLVELGRTDLLWASGWVPEASAALLGRADSVQLRPTGSPDITLGARIVSVSRMVDATRRSIEVKAEVRAVPSSVRPGSFASLLLPVGPVAPRAILPAEAVQRIDGQDMVFIEVEPGLFRTFAVDALVLPEETMAVTGLSEGDRVVAHGAYLVRSAMESAGGEG